jgi:hypothetical protein
MKTEVMEPIVKDAKGPESSNRRFEVLVYVRMPDGSFLWLPVARPYEEKVAEFSSKKDANNWVEFCLPDKVRIQEATI